MFWKGGRRSDLAFSEKKKVDRRERILHMLFLVGKLFNSEPAMSEHELSNPTRNTIHLPTQLCRWWV
jgi:hypothetical protein